jgi:urease accessory protein
MTWHARLHLDHRLESGRCVARHRHDGPLRILQSLYPEGDAICHNVLVHPPGGLVGGDTLDITVQVADGAHGLVTTPGATRYYRSAGEAAVQRAHLTLAAGARLEWLPLEALCYDACQAENHLTLDLAPGAELLGWDITALGLPDAGLPFVRGQFLQHIEMPGVWLERGRLAADDTRLLDGPLGLAGHRCLASVFFATGAPLNRARREAMLDAARGCVEGHDLTATTGVTAPNDRVLVARMLAHRVEPAMQLARRLRAAWRRTAWGLAEHPPRIWAM